MTERGKEMQGAKLNRSMGLVVDAFTFVILLATLTMLVPYAYSAAAQAYLYITEPHLFERKAFLPDVAIAMLAFAYSMRAITGSGKDIIAKGFVLLPAGIPGGARGIPAGAMGSRQ